MKILISTYENYPSGSGIANVVYNLNKHIKKNNQIQILSPIGPDIPISQNRILIKLGGISIYLFWRSAFKYITKNYKKYDIILLQNPLFTQKFHKKKLFCTVHTTFNEYSKMYNKIYSNRFMRLYYSIISYLEKTAYKKVNSKHDFIVTSNKTIDELKALGLKNKIYLISNGADVAKFKPSQKKRQLRKSLHLPVDKRIILFVGRVEHQKKPLQMIQTFSLVNKEVQDLTLLIIGQGSLLKTAKAFCKKHSTSNVIFTGQINQDKITNYYAAADYFIMCSMYEGQPLSLLEALSAGLVPILSDIPIFKDMVKLTNSGICLSFKSPEKASEKIINFIKKGDISQESAKIRKFAEDNLDWKDIAKQYLKIFKAEQK